LLGLSVDLTAEQDLHTDAAPYGLAQAAQTADALTSMGWHSPMLILVSHSRTGALQLQK
jgi:hypothetical protein